MPESEGNGPNSAAQGGVAALAIAAFAVICCAGFPLLAAIAGGVALGTVMGAGAGLVALVVLVGLAASRRRRRRSCEMPRQGARPRDDEAAAQRSR